ncbi:HK97-gp10 family putative phage morphogenesis protein [Staphylococcus chromogenes]|uniref:HK97-gp10 family putative phage morphogenesis protein n=1 Tax=Staphylococcus chromogenes TaxID=46126 RepID=UPI003D797110
MKISGMNGYIRQLEKMRDNIEFDVDQIMARKAVEMNGRVKKQARTVMIKGYWTGNLSRMIETTRNGKLSYTVSSDAKYSGFLEYGTRYMNAEPFMYPVYFEIARELRKELKDLID